MDGVHVRVSRTFRTSAPTLSDMTAWPKWRPCGWVYQSDVILNIFGFSVSYSERVRLRSNFHFVICHNSSPSLTDALNTTFSLLKGRCPSAYQGWKFCPIPQVQKLAPALPSVMDSRAASRPFPAPRAGACLRARVSGCERARARSCRRRASVCSGFRAVA